MLLGIEKVKIIYLSLFLFVCCIPKCYDYGLKMEFYYLSSCLGNVFFFCFLGKGLPIRKPCEKPS